MSVRLTTLGVVRAFRGDEELPELPAQRLRFALLVYLALERDVSRETVLSVFWPDRDNGRGKHALRQMLYELRQALGDDWVELRRDRIVARVAVDAREFEAAAEQGRVDDALGVYGGPFLHGFSLENRAFESWVERRRAQIGRTFRRLQREQIAALLAAGDSEGALSAARRWVELDPLEDEAAHTLIERLAASGQRAAALQYYESYEQQLTVELDVKPLDETKELVAAIRAGDAVPQDILRPPARPEGTPAESGPVPSAQAAVGAPVRATPAGVNVPPSIPWHRTKTTRRSAFAAMVLLAIGAAVMLGRPGPGIPLAADRPVRIVVLPLVDHSADRSLNQLALELTETLARSLSQSPLLEVVSPNGVRAMREEGIAERDLGSELDAQYLVGGSVSTEGSGIRLNVELLSGADMTIVHSDTVRRPGGESWTLVELVVDRAALILRGEIGAAVLTARVRAGTRNEEAWQKLLQARRAQQAAVAALGVGDLATHERELVGADSILAVAARLDRKWAEPVAMRGRVLEGRVAIRTAMPDRDTTEERALLDQALQYAEASTERDPDYAEGWAVRGSVRYRLAGLARDPLEMDRLLDLAEQDLMRATRLDDLHQRVWGQLAELRINRRSYLQARAAAEQAYRLDPYAPEVPRLLNALFSATFELEQDEQAQSWCLDGRKRFPEDLPFLYCLLALHAWSDNIPAQPEVLRRAIEAVGPRGLGQTQPELPARLEHMVAAAFARAGQPDSARALIARYRDRRDPALLWLRASVYVQLGEDSAALALLGEYMEKEPGAASVARRRQFRRLSMNPEFVRLIADAR